jgi:hypothetical protein
MSYSIKIQENTGLWIVVDDNTGKNISRGATPLIAINLAIEKGMPSENKEALLIEAQQQIAAEQAALVASIAERNAQTASSGEILQQSTPVTASAEDSAAAPSNAEQTYNPAALPDFGLNDNPVPLSDTQAIPPVTGAPGAANSTLAPSYGIDFGAANEDAGTSGGARAAALPTREAGVGAPGDDNATRNRINSIYNGSSSALVPQPNVLDKYSSYTYSISIYISSPQAYAKLLNSKQKSTAGMQLLMQSGGASQVATAVSEPASTSYGMDFGAAADTGPSVAGPTTTRNQYFPVDFYIDDVKMQSVIMGKGTRGSHNVVNLSFRILEPNGITLLDNLYYACQQFATMQGSSVVQNYAAQTYLMVVRFYGYDSNGTLINANGDVVNLDQTQGPPALIEKYIPFQFTGIKFRVANKLTEYECTASCPQNNIATGQGRGVVPYNFQVTATTLKELLSGTAAFSNTLTTESTRSPNLNTYDINNINAPPAASAAAKPTIVSGLAAALNKVQNELVQQNTFLIPDEYEIVIVDAEMQNAKTQPPVIPGSFTDNFTVGMIQPKTAADALLPSKQSVNFQSKNSAMLAGTSVVQIIDQVVRNSTYIYDQQIKLPTVNRQGVEVDTKPPPGRSNGVFAWYRIGVEASPKGYDALRNDYAYKIRYQVSIYKVNGVRSDYFPSNVRNGSHKQYKYWYTGQNSQILNFEQDFNYLYYITVNASNRSLPVNSDRRELEKYTMQTRSNISDQGQAGKINEPGANAADYLYSPSDQSRVKMTIVGDPAWIQQGELWAGLQGQTIYQQNFLQDGTINFENQEVLFELEFNKPVDYDMSTGLMNPNRGGQLGNPSAGKPNNLVYKAIEVISNFSRGKFTQDLSGVLITFPEPAASDTDSETARRFSNSAQDSTSRVQLTEVIDTSQGFAASITRSIPVNSNLTSGNPFNINIAGIYSPDPTVASPLADQAGLFSIFPAFPPAPPTSGSELVGVEEVIPAEEPIRGDLVPNQLMSKDY